MTSAEIFDGRTRLTLTDPIGSGGSVDYLSVRVEGPDLSAGRQVYAGWAEGFVGLGHYFAELARSWRGWSGEQVFESIEADLRLVAIHDGQVQLTIDLWESTEPRGWRVQAQLRIEAGEQLTEAAREVAALVGQ